MANIRKTDRVGLGIARLFSVCGWVIAILGVAAVAYGVYSTDGLTERVAASVPGFAMTIFGFFSVLMAVQTRAALETAETMRELLRLAGKTGSPVSRPMTSEASRKAGAPPAAPAAPNLPPLSSGDGGAGNASAPPALSAPKRGSPRSPIAADISKKHPIFSAGPPR